MIAVVNQKGGVGKTTTTVNLAAPPWRTGGLRVLVVDLDPQGNASTGLGVDHRVGTPNVYDLLVDGKEVHEVVQPVEGFEGLYCVPATIDLAGAEIELVSVVAREQRLARALNAYEEEIDYVLIDCPPSLGLLTVNALVASEEVLIPIQCEYYALEGVGPAGQQRRAGQDAPEPAAAHLHHPAHDVRPADTAGGAGGRRGARTTSVSSCWRR